MQLLSKLRLDLVPDYFVALYEQWHAILWVQLPQRCSSSCGGPSAYHPPQQLPFGLCVRCSLQVTSFGGQIMFGLLPKFAVPRVHIQHTPNQVGRSVWIQLEPECLSDVPVEECEGRLIRVMHKWPPDSGVGDGGW